jgi:hypothetical protein
MENKKKEHYENAPPSIEQLMEWEAEGFCQAIDGCFPVEPDGYCQHGKPSWMIVLGLI